MEIFITLTKYNTLQRHEGGNPLPEVNYLEYYSICRAPNQTSKCSANVFSKMGPGAEPYLRHTQKCLGPCQHSPKKEHLMRQAINLAHPRRFRAWGDGLLRLEESRPRDVNAGLPQHSRQASILNRVITTARDSPYITPFQNNAPSIMRIGTYTLMFIGTVYNIYQNGDYQIIFCTKLYVDNMLTRVKLLHIYIQQPFCTSRK